VFHYFAGCLVKDKIVSKVKVMDVLSLHLDRSVCPGSKDMPLTQRWEHLADEFNVPDEKKRQCENFTGNLSPSENMLEYLCVTHDLLPIKTLKDHLRELGRKDVVADLDNNRDLPGKKSKGVLFWWFNSSKSSITGSNDRSMCTNQSGVKPKVIRRAWCKRGY